MAKENTIENNVIIGIDIGSTTISAVIIDIEANNVLKTYTVDNNSKLNTDSDLFEYDTKVIIDSVGQIVKRITSDYQNIKSIGITGQMHGIVYVDDSGKAVSPLYSWQDGRGNREINNGNTYCEEIFKRTGYTVFSGCGFSTAFYNKYNCIEPKAAKSFCTIMDYIAMSLSGNVKPYIHPSNAASLGVYDIEKNCFDIAAIEKLDLSHLVMPEISDGKRVLGFYNDIPISVAIGDNQASFFGSVKQENNTALVNFGTGSQISVVLEKINDVNENLEIRPYLFGKYLLCGSALCGGKAYSIIEKFFSKYAELLLVNSGSQYENMNKLAQKAYLQKEYLNVSTQFCGTRKEPDLRGFITGIDDINFTPEGLVLGTLYGMVNELKDYFDKMNVDNITDLAASGNLVQKNPILNALLKEVFNFNVDITDNKEEAAVGAALYAGLSNNIIEQSQIQKIISYRQ